MADLDFVFVSGFGMVFSLRHSVFRDATQEDEFPCKMLYVVLGVPPSHPVMQTVSANSYRPRGSKDLNH